MPVNDDWASVEAASLMAVDRDAVVVLTADKAAVGLMAVVRVALTDALAVTEATGLMAVVSDPVTAALAAGDAANWAPKDESDPVTDDAAVSVA